VISHPRFRFAGAGMTVMKLGFAIASVRTSSNRHTHLDEMLDNFKHVLVNVLPVTRVSQTCFKRGWQIVKTNAVPVVVLALIVAAVAVRRV